MHAVLKYLQKYKLYIKLNKCVFKIDIVNFLDFIISPRDVEMEKSRIEAIVKWPKPIYIKNV